MTAKVSVIIPNYNRAGLVNETVRNVLSQTLRPFEVIVVDDGSTDDSVAQLTAEFGEAITVIEQANQGPGAARNKGLARASGEFIWLMDSDDLASLNKLDTQVAALQLKEADVVYSPWVRAFFVSNSRIELDGPVLQQAAVPHDRDELTWFLTDWSVVFQHCLFRATAIRDAGVYRTDLWTCDDTEYFARILATGARVVFDPRSVTVYRADDHGKVTGSGFRSVQRIIDWANCLLIMRELSNDTVRLSRHRDYQARLWVSLNDLRESCPNESELIERVEAAHVLSPFASMGGQIVNRITKKVRRIFTGSHWSRAYQVGPINDAQRKLIAELGYSVA